MGDAALQLPVGAQHREPRQTGANHDRGRMTKGRDRCDGGPFRVHALARGGDPERTDGRDKAEAPACARHGKVESRRGSEEATFGVDHGQFVESKLGRTSVATLHPSAILRAEDGDREDAMAMLVGDLKLVRKRLD